MKLALLTTLAIHVALAAATEPKAMPKLFGAEELGEYLSQPDYCFAPTPPDFYCYKDGYPKCCTKTKGNCPNNEDNKPGCECNGGNDDCNPGMDNNRGSSCILGDNDCRSDEYCAVDDGQCLLRIAEIRGRCTKKPEVCTLDMNQVCGCDDRTYDNSCVAASNGVNVASNERCRNNDRDSSCILGDNNCPRGEYCAVDEGMCMDSTTEVRGRCTPKPEMCTLNIDKVCGCDGTTYDNSCLAASNGVNVESNKRCRNRNESNESCTYLGVDNDSCSGNNSFCQIETGFCRRRSLSQAGTCMQRPEMCPADWNPVCGCDGVTYANECSAFSAGVNVMRDSEC